jgi:hypothetical protein
MMNIVTSIHVYNFHLFISYLGKGVEIIRFEDIHDKFIRERVDYPERLGFTKALQEITTYGNQLFGVTDSTVNRFTLTQQEPPSVQPIFSNLITSQISLDFSYSELYLLSENDGINEVNIIDPIRPRIVKKIVPETFEKIGDPTISNMISKNRYILLAYRGYGATKISNNPGQPLNEIIYRSEDAQDVRYSDKLNLVIVADGIEGLVLYNAQDASVIKKKKLNESDFPQEIKFFKRDVLIKGKNGLYIYYLENGSIKQIWEGSIGAFTTYYNYIFFSSKGQVHLLVESNEELSHFKLRDEERIEIKVNQYLH